MTEGKNTSLEALDKDIASLQELLAKTGDEALKFDQRMKVYSRLEKFYNLRLRFSGTGRGGAFNSS